jgi:hypothetical protein
MLLGWGDFFRNLYVDVGSFKSGLIIVSVKNYPPHKKKSQVLVFLVIL